MIATAGEVNAGHFDPIAEMSRLARAARCVAACRRRVRPVRAHVAADGRTCRGRRARRLGHLRRAQVAERPARLRLCLRPRPGAPDAGLLREARRTSLMKRCTHSERPSFPGELERSPSGQRSPRMGETGTARSSNAASTTQRTSHASSMKPTTSNCSLPLRSISSASGIDHRHAGGAARRAEPADRPRDPARRPRLRRHDQVGRNGGLPACVRQLADDGRGCRPDAET